MNSSENQELKDIYNNSKNIYDVSSTLIEMLDNGVQYEKFDSLAELYSLVYLTQESSTSSEGLADKVGNLPDIEKLSSYELPKYWSFFFINTLEFMAQKMGETFSLEDDNELPFTEEAFLVQAKLWVTARLSKMVVLNSGTEGLEKLNQYLFDGVLASFLENAKNATVAIDENEKVTLEQYWTIQINEALESIQEKMLHVPVHLHKENEYPRYYELIKFYPVSLVYLFVNEQQRTNLDMSMLVGMLQASNNGTLIVLSQIEAVETMINHNELIGYLIHDSGASVRWYDQAIDFFNECAHNEEELGEDNDRDLTH